MGRTVAGYAEPAAPRRDAPPDAARHRGQKGTATSGVSCVRSTRGETSTFMTTGCSCSCSSYQLCLAFHMYYFNVGG